MHAQVPQFIDIEDKIIGPFTLKQFGYLAGGLAIAGMFYMFLTLAVAIIFGLPIVLFSLALAFYTINGRPFLYYVSSYLGYGIKQHIYIWQKPLEEYDVFLKQKSLEKKAQAIKIPEFAQSSIKKSSWSLDLFGKKEIFQKTEALQTEKERAEEVAGTETKIAEIKPIETKTISYKEIKWGPNVVGAEEIKM